MTHAERMPEPPAEPGHVPAEELARRQGVRPLRSAAELRQPGVFDSDEELEEFLADRYAARRAEQA